MVERFVVFIFLFFIFFIRTPRPSVYIVICMLCDVLTRLSFYVLLYPNYAFIVSCHLEDEGRDGKRKDHRIVPPCVRLLICQCASCVPWLCTWTNISHCLCRWPIGLSQGFWLSEMKPINKQTNDLLTMNSILIQFADLNWSDWETSCD